MNDTDTTCHVCKGSGLPTGRHFDTKIQCGTCGGVGELPDYSRDIFSVCQELHGWRTGSGGDCYEPGAIERDIAFLEQRRRTWREVGGCSMYEQAVRMLVEEALREGKEWLAFLERPTEKKS